MKKRILSLLLVAIIAFIQSGVYGKPTRNCVSHGFCFTITPPKKNTPTSLYSFELEAPSTIGWVAVGVGPSMIGSYMIMAWPSSNGSAIVSQRVAPRYGIPTFAGQQDDIRLDTTGSGVKNGKFIAKFTRAVSVTGSTIESIQDFVWALQSEEKPPDEISTYDISIHNAKGRFTVESTPEPPENPPSPPSPPSHPSHPHSSKPPSAPSKPSNSNPPLISTLSTYDKYIIIHGAVMFLVWGIVVPGAIFIARFARNIIPQKWFKLHWGIQQFVASPLALFGILMSFAAGVSYNPSNTHHVLGMIVFGGFTFQLSLGWIHHKLYDPTRKNYPWWTKLHWWWGRILTLLAFIQLLLGLQQYNVSHGIFVAYYCYVLLVVISFAGLSYHLYKKRRRDLETFAKSDIVYTGIRQDDVEQQS